MTALMAEKAQSEIEAFVDELLVELADKRCAGCGITLREHREQPNNFFEFWGEQDASWRGRRPASNRFGGVSLGRPNSRRGNPARGRWAN